MEVLKLKIVYLGWGSLIWNPGKLKTEEINRDRHLFLLISLLQREDEGLIGGGK